MTPFILPFHLLLATSASERASWLIRASCFTCSCSANNGLPHLSFSLFPFLFWPCQFLFVNIGQFTVGGLLIFISSTVTGLFGKWFTEVRVGVFVEWDE